MMHAFPRTFRLGDALPIAALAPSVLPPLAPAAYLALRRKAAGLSQEQVAAGLSRAIVATTADCLDLVKTLERPGATALRRETLDTLRAIFPFDPDVYRQLAAEPADRHPRVCRACGCSTWDACDEDGQGCGWATAASCTRCAGDDAAAESAR